MAKTSKTYRCANCRLKHYCSENKDAGLFGMEDPPQKRKSRKAVLSISAPTDNLLPLNNDSQSYFPSTLEDDHAAAIPPSELPAFITSSNVPIQFPEGEPQQKEIHSAAIQDDSLAVVPTVAPLPSHELLIIHEATSFCPDILSKDFDDTSASHTVQTFDDAGALAPTSLSSSILSPLETVNNVVDLTVTNLLAAVVDVTSSQESSGPETILTLSPAETLATKVSNTNVKDIIVELKSDSNVRTCGNFLGGFVVSDADTSLVDVLGEIYSTGYRLVHEPHSNMTLSIGSEYSKVNIDGQDGQDRWVFIQALEVSLENVIDKDTLPLNFMFLESSAVKNFLKRCGNIIINIYLSIYIYLFIYLPIYLPIYLFYLYFLFFILLLV